MRSALAGAATTISISATNDATRRCRKKREEFHGHTQNGVRPELKKRLSQPIALDCATGPRPP